MKRVFFLILFAVSASLAFTACTPPTPEEPDPREEGTVIYNPIVMPED